MEEIIKSLIEQNIRLHDENNRLTRDITQFEEHNRNLVTVNDFLTNKVRELEERLVKSNTEH